MKIKLPSLACSALSIVLFALSGCSEKIDAGQATIVNGLWYKAGKPFSGIIENIKTEFYGQIYIGGACAINVENGRLHGKIECAHRDGKIIYSSNYKNGELQGAEERHDIETGKLIESRSWENGSKVGKEQFLDKSGSKLLASFDWKNGVKTGFDNRDDYSELTFKGGQLHGTQKYYKVQIDGKRHLEKIENYDDGKLDGLTQYFDDKNHVAIEDVYKHGIALSHLRQTWDENNIPTSRLYEINPSPSQNSGDQSTNKLVKDGRQFSNGPAGNLEWESEWKAGKPIKGVFNKWATAATENGQSKLIYSLSGIPDQTGTFLVKNGVEIIDYNSNNPVEITWKKGVPVQVVWKEISADGSVKITATKVPDTLDEKGVGYVLPTTSRLSPIDGYFNTN